MKIEWLIANVTSFGSPDKAEPDIFGMILDIFWKVQAAFVPRETLFDVGTLS